MESNIKNKIKLFEQTKTQYTESNPTVSMQAKEETPKSVTHPTAKPRRKKKKQVQTEQTEYVNIIPVKGAEAQGYANLSDYPVFDPRQLVSTAGQASLDFAEPGSEYVNLGDYPEFDPSQFLSTDGQSLAFAEPGSEYANLGDYPGFDPSQFVSTDGQISLDFAESGSEYANLSDNYWEFESATQLDYSHLEPYDLEKSEYANLLPLATARESKGPTERIYADPEGRLLSIQENQPNKLTVDEVSIDSAQIRLEKSGSEYANFPLSEPNPEQFYESFKNARTTAKKKKTKKQITASEKEASDPGGIRYAELDLAQPKYVNVLHKSQLDTTEEDTESIQYSYLSRDNRLIPSNQSAQDNVLSTARNEQEKIEPLEVQGVTVSGARNKIQRRKKNTRKDNCPGSLPVKFEKLNIQPIQEQEEATEDMSHVRSSSEMQQREKKPSRFKFFTKKSKKLTQEMKESTSHSEVMQNK